MGNIVVLLVIWGSVIYFLSHYGDHILAAIAKDPLIGAAISFLW